MPAKPIRKPLFYWADNRWNVSIKLTGAAVFGHGPRGIQSRVGQSLAWQDMAEAIMLDPALLQSWMCRFSLAHLEGIHA